MCALVLLNLLNKLGKSYKMQGLPSILALFSIESNKFNDNHMALKLLNNHIFSVKMSRFCHLLCSIIKDIIIIVVTKSVNLHCVIALPDATSSDN